MKRAVIDIGSNSIKMIVFDSDKDIRESKYFLEIPQIVKGKKGGYLSVDSVERALRSLEILKEKAEVAEIYAYATESLRSAKNSDIFIERARKYGIEVEILDTKDEAKIAYESVKLNYKGDFCVCDIGGASSEICNGEMFLSFPVGSLVLFENPKKLDFKVDIKTSKLYAIGGTALVIAQIFSEDYSLNHEDRIIRKYELIDLIEKFKNMDFKDRIEKYSKVEPKRLRIIDRGMEILLHILEELHLEEVHISMNVGMYGYASLRGLIND